jgi:hypothetical protein
MSVFSNKKKITENRLTSTITATPENNVKLTESYWNKSPTNLGVRKTNRFSKNSSGFFTAESKKKKKKKKENKFDKMTMKELKSKANELNLSDADVGKFGKRTKRDTYIDAINKKEENSNTNVDNNNEEIIVTKNKKNGDKKRDKKKNGIGGNFSVPSFPDVSVRSGGAITTAKGGVALATAYYVREMFKWTTSAIRGLGESIMYGLFGFVGLFAFIRLYDTYTKRVEEYENFGNMNDDELKVKIEELHEQLCYWDGIQVFGRELRPFGLELRPECRLIKAEYDRAIEIREQREEQREEERKIREEADSAYDNLKNELEARRRIRISENLRDKLLDDVRFCKLMIQTAEQKSNYKATEEDIIKLSQDFNKYQKLWKIDVPVKHYISDTKFIIRRKRLIAGFGQQTNDVFYTKYSSVLDLKEKARLLGQAFIYCAELHVNKVIAWMRIEKELNDEIESLNNDKIKRIFQQQWVRTPTGKAKERGIYADIQKLKVPPNMTYEKMMVVSVNTINNSLEHLNKKYIKKLPDEIQEKFKIIENNMNDFKCYRTFGMMSSLKLIKAANENFKEMENNSKKLENLEKNTEEYELTLENLTTSYEMYNKYMNAHQILRNDNHSPEFIKQICDGNKLLFNKAWKLADYIINEGIINEGKPEQKNKKRPKESIMNKVNKQLLLTNNYEKSNEKKVESESEESESEEEGEKKEGENVPLKKGQKISGYKIGRDGQQKVYTGTIVRIHEKEKNKGKVVLKIESGDRITNVIIPGTAPDKKQTKGKIPKTKGKKKIKKISQ